MKRRPAMPRRYAMTLLETAVAIGLIGLLMALLSTVVLRLLQADTRTQNHAFHIRSLTSLADQFRTDLHDAVEVTLADDSDSSTLRIQASDHRAVEYVIESDRIRRCVSDGSKVTAREAYRLPAESTAGFAVLRVLDQRFARVRVQQLASSRMLLEAIAAVGRDRRFRETPSS